ncbi:hypothetical protein [Thermogutta sp.]
MASLYRKPVVITDPATGQPIPPGESKKYYRPDLVRKALAGP